MKGILFFTGCALIAIAMGMPEGLTTHSGGMKSPLPYFFYWLTRLIDPWGGKYLVVLVGLAMVVSSFFIPRRSRESKGDGDQ
jgi:ABC-type transport system involved in cytochrome c biogenesis permease subunit